MASNSYTPPGVSVREIVEPSIAPILADASTIALVGPASGTITKTDVVTLEGEAAVVLPGISVEDTMAVGAIVRVVDAIEPALSEAEEDGVYAEGDTGYIFDHSAHTIKRGSETTIPDGHAVYVTYEYTPATYFSPVRMTSLTQVTTRFGEVYDSTGMVINSPLSCAASIAFENGAQELVLQPLFYNNGGTKQIPTDEQIAKVEVWADNFSNLVDFDDINLLVPVIGQSSLGVSDSVQLSIIQAAQDYAKFMLSEQQYVMIIAGEDSSQSSSVGKMETLRSHATTLAGRYGGSLAEQTILVSPSKYFRLTPTAQATQIPIGGQYMAAAIAGMIASAPVSRSLTRKYVAGFSAVGEGRSLADKNADAATGLLVIEPKVNGIQIRHGITINTAGGASKREISVVRAKHVVVESLRETIDTQIIGQVVADGSAPSIVRSTVIGVLERLRFAGDIVDYKDVQSAQQSLDPTVIEVRFSYRPAFPVNYVNIVFSLDLTTGTLSEAEATQ